MKLVRRRATALSRDGVCPYQLCKIRPLFDIHCKEDLHTSHRAGLRHVSGTILISHWVHFP